MLVPPSAGLTSQWEGGLGGWGWGWGWGGGWGAGEGTGDLSREAPRLSGGRQMAR